MKCFLSWAFLGLLVVSGSRVYGRLADDVVGKWNGKSGDISLVLELKSDKSASLTMTKDGNAKVVTGKFQDGQITLDDGSGTSKKVKYELKDSKLVLKPEGDSELVFDRVKPASGDGTPMPAPKANGDGKFSPPKFAEGEQTWDVSALDGNFKIIKCTLVEERIVFLVEAKQKVDSFAGAAYQYKLNFYDSDGVKFRTSTVGFEPYSADKGDRVRMTSTASLSKQDQSKTVKIVVVAP